MELAQACGYAIAGLYHYAPGRTGDEVHGFRILGTFEELLAGDLSGRNFVLTMGDADIRLELAERILRRGGTLPSLIHPQSVVSAYAAVSAEGVYINPYCVIQGEVSIERLSMLEPGAAVAHGCRIGAGCFMAAGAVIGAGTLIEERVFVGQSAVCIAHKVGRIGARAYIAAGALLTRSVPPGAMMIGAPARISDRPPRASLHHKLHLHHRGTGTRTAAMHKGRRCLTPVQGCRPGPAIPAVIPCTISI